MRDFIIALLVGFVLFRVIRTFVYRNVSDAFKQQNQRRQQPPFNQRTEGDVTIENTSAGQSKFDKKGEYVDYEEIKSEKK